MANTKKKKKKKASPARKAAAGKKHKMQPDMANITVSGGVGVPDPCTVYPGELIHFMNDDNQDYLIELFVDENHPVVDVLLPALGDCRLMAEPNAKDGDKCAYNLVPTVLKKATPAGGGSHTIIISSGTKAAAKAAAG
jgi:hypothetical protein